MDAGLADEFHTDQDGFLLKLIMETNQNVFPPWKPALNLGNQFKNIKFYKVEILGSVLFLPRLDVGVDRWSSYSSQKLFQSAWPRLVLYRTNKRVMGKTLTLLLNKF